MYRPTILEVISHVRTEMERVDKALQQTEQMIHKDRTVLISGCKETAKLRRASMDLSRALVYLRRPWRREGPLMEGKA